MKKQQSKSQIEGKGIRREDKLEQDIIAGRKVFLYDDNDCNGVGVEGYEAGQEYEVDEVRIRPTWGVQIFLKGNIHSYPIKSFIKIN